MSRSRSFLTGAAFAYTYQALLMLVGLWLTPFYIHTLGQRDYGIWLVGLQVLNFLLLCDFGVIVVTPRDIAQAAGLEETGLASGEVARVVGQTLKVVIAQTVLVGAAAAILFALKPAHDAALRGPIGLVLFVFVISYPLRLFPAILQGLQDFKFLGQLRLTLWTISIATVVVLLLSGARFYALAWGWCIQQMGHDIVTFFRVRKSRRDLLSVAVWRSAGPMHWRWFLRGFWVNVNQIASALTAGSDLLIVGRFINAATVVVYSSTGKLMSVLQNQPQILASVALPGLSHMRSSESRERTLQAATSLTQAMLLLAGAVFCVVIAVNREFVAWWLRGAGGPRLFGGVALTVLLLLNFLWRQIDYTLSVTLFACGHERWISIRALVDGAVSVLVASLLVRPWGMVGVAIGLLCGVLFVSIPADVFMFSRTLQVSAAVLSRPYFPYLWRIAIAGCVAFVIENWLDTANLLHIVLSASLAAAVYALLVLPHVWRTPLRGYIDTAIAAAKSSVRARVLRSTNA